MDMSDEQLLDFDKERLADWNEERAARALAGEDGALYRNHLAIAQWIDGWVERMAPDVSDASSPEFERGYIQGIREVAAHLRQTDLLPDGIILKNA
ncbi:hypothetical protein [Streptomyces sp. NPDC093223]|uniref:hypothetical protein n=1 Tax=Streptomyces sp. NPDC093223 TaxID=3366033 RepID=UPI00380CF1BD